MTSQRLTPKVGVVVHWTSQSQGSTTSKSGTVVAILPSGTKPDPSAYPKLAKNCGGSRDHESYIVEVMRGAKKTIPTYYWPVVSSLHMND
jgi:hypothetical protein